jgi:hypothetical protein
MYTMSCYVVCMPHCWGRSRLTDQQRAKILGLNAARFFKFDINSLLKKRLARISTI